MNRIGLVLSLALGLASPALAFVSDRRTHLHFDLQASVGTVSVTGLTRR